ncbi:hypothetical protein QYF36_013340 [Acer negundo]|nr:hypothetical protein QYF36_013340 [Acer negundo]
MKQIPREKNHRTDVLANITATGGQTLPKGVPLQLMLQSSIARRMKVTPVSRLPCWMDPIAEYLHNEILCVDPDQARKLKRIATRYYLVEGYFYRKVKSFMLLRCLHLDDAQLALNEVHVGDYDNHVLGGTLAYQVLRIGYYWPTLHHDAKKFAQSCEPYLIRPLSTAPGQAKHVVIAIDYFTRWVEAKSLTKITEANTTNFAKKKLVCQFGTPIAIITDLGKQFDNANFREFCEGRGIDLRFASMAHPQTNGQTTKRTTTGETPYSLAFGIEAVSPIEHKLTSFRVQYFEPKDNDMKLRASLDLLKEKRDKAAKRVVAYQSKIARCFNKKVKTRIFKEGDSVLRKVTQNTRKRSDGVVAPNRESPYLIKIVV